MKLMLQIKLLPNKEQEITLLSTLRSANAACDVISETAWQDNIFNQFKLHKKCYHSIRTLFPLSAQVVVRCISKVADSYKLDKKSKRTFREFGSIAYDSRILSYSDSIASIWSVGGRLKIPFICHNSAYLPYIKGEADLVFKKGKFYLFQTCEVPEEDVEDVEDFIGVDFGCKDIVALSDGISVSSEWINNYRTKRQQVRSSIQSKGTKGAKKLLKRLSGKEKVTAKIINHAISKNIVKKAKVEGLGIAIEDLNGIRKRTERRVHKAHRGLRSKWSYGQLRQFITYKAQLSGVKLVVIPPAYTSQTCHSCLKIGTRKSKNFFCETCGNFDADTNAAKVISQVGAAINQPEKSNHFACAICV